MTDRLPFELRVPGTWLALPDRQISWDIQTQLYSIQSAFDEATIALMLFEKAQVEARQRFSREYQEPYGRRRAEIEQSLPVEDDEGPFDIRRYDERRAEIDAQVVRRLWAEGFVPRQLQHHIPFIYAKAFLYAADTIGKILARLSENPDLPDGARELCRAFYSSFPELREVRNSAQHIEDRGRGLGKGGKPLDLKPVDNAMINAPNGALILNTLNGNRYGSTMADGHYGEVEVSAASLATIRDMLESTFAALPWTGPPDQRPRP